MGEVLIGTSSWTDPTLLESGWYPAGASTAEARLAYYASQFSLVEVDSTYYGLPSERNSVLWAQRTPSEFTFDVKAFSMLTQHPTPVTSLPKSLRAAAGSAAKLAHRDTPPQLLDEVFEMFRSALMPLHSAGKLGFVLFQFPEWFLSGDENRAYIESCAARLPDYRLAIEFRRRDWMQSSEQIAQTARWLAGAGLAYVNVDMPQGFASSMPPLTLATTDDIAVVRFHGRNVETWKKRGITAAERFSYLYSEKELQECAPRVREISERARRTHVLFNNCFRDYGVRNAAQMSLLLADAG